MGACVVGLPARGVHWDLTDKIDPILISTNGEMANMLRVFEA